MTEIVPLLMAAIVAYLLGSISFARIVGSFTAPGVNLTHTTIPVPQTGEVFEVGGVPSSALMGRASVPARLAVVLLDMAKAGVPTWAFHAAFPDSPAYAVAFTAAVLGHNWPVYYRFVGGFGISCTIGAVLAFDPLGLLVTIPIGLVVGKLFLDNMSMINGFTILLPIWFLVARQDVEATVASLVVLGAYLVAKRLRLTHIKTGTTKPGTTTAPQPGHGRTDGGAAGADG